MECMLIRGLEMFPKTGVVFYEEKKLCLQESPTHFYLTLSGLCCTFSLQEDSVFTIWNMDCCSTSANMLFRSLHVTGFPN